MNLFDQTILDLRPDEYLETADEVFLAEHVVRLLGTVQLNYQFRHNETERWLELGYPNRNARYILQVMRRFPCLLTCGFTRGETIFEFLRMNGVGDFVPAGTVGDEPRGLIYCTELEDALLAKLRFNDVKVIECKPEKFDGRFNPAYECTPLEIAYALGDDVNHV